MADSSSSTVDKVVGLAAAAAAAFVAQKVVGVAWKASSGHKPPKPEDGGESALAEILAAAAITGAVVARVLATRGASRVTARRGSD
jgi:hypothetical protein